MQNKHGCLLYKDKNFPFKINNLQSFVQFSKNFAQDGGLGLADGDRIGNHYKKFDWLKNNQSENPKNSKLTKYTIYIIIII